MTPIKSRVHDYLLDHPCQTAAEIAQAMGLDPLQVSYACRILKRRGIADYEARAARSSGRYVVWFLVDGRPREDVREVRYAAFLPLWRARSTHAYMRDQLQIASDTLCRLIARARAEGVDRDEAPAPVRRVSRPRNLAPPPYHRGWSWTART